MIHELDLTTPAARCIDLPGTGDYNSRDRPGRSSPDTATHARGRSAPATDASSRIDVGTQAVGVAFGFAPGELDFKRRRSRRSRRTAQDRSHVTATTSGSRSPIARWSPSRAPCRGRARLRARRERALGRRRGERVIGSLPCAGTLTAASVAARDLAHDLDDVAVRVPDAQLPVGAVAAREDVADALELALGAELAARAARCRGACAGSAARPGRGSGGRWRDP